VRAAAIVLGLLLCRQAAAQALDGRPAGAAGLALAGCGASGLRSPAALWTNPALLPQARFHLGLELGLLSDTRQLTVTEVVNQPALARDLDGAHLSPGLVLAHPLGLSWLWGAVGYQLARQVHSRYPAEQLDAAGRVARAAPARYLGDELTLEQHVVALALAAGGRRAGLGASLELSHVRLAHRRAWWAGATGDRSIVGDPRLDLDAAVSGKNTLDVGALLGGWVRPLTWLEVGVAVRVPTTAGIDGEVTLSPGPRAPAGTEALDVRGGSARLELHLPLELRAGVTLGPPRWRLTVEAGYQRWSSADQPTAELQGAALLLSPSSGAPYEQPLERLPLGIGLRDTLVLRAGLELAPWGERLVLRTGYAYHRGASVSRLPSPVLLDLDRHVWGLGVEARLGRLALGAAFAHDFEARLDASESRTELMNPVEPAVTGPIGAGLYQGSRVQIIFEATVGW